MYKAIEILPEISRVSMVSADTFIYHILWPIPIGKKTFTVISQNK